MDGWAYAVVDNSQKRGKGNRERATGNLGTPVPRGKGGNRERGTGNREQGTGNGEQGTGNRDGEPARGGQAGEQETWGHPWP
jgi:hypothetical protein